MLQRPLRDAVLVLVGAAAIALMIAHVHKTRPPARASSRLKTHIALAPPPLNHQQPQTLKELLALPLEELEGVDIAVMNLLCAEGLRGAEDLDVKKHLELLDSLTRQVQWETKRNFHRFQERPREYKNSLAYYRMGMLGTVLAEDYGMRFNPQLEIPWVHGKRTEQEANYANSRDIFIHGLLDGKRFGTCASMPVLYVAIARRLGYPVNLAATKYHLYARYEQEDGGHLNVEATENRGFTTPTDEEYRKGPFPSTEEQIRALGWLRPMTGREMLGAFLFGRAGCLRSMKRYGEESEAIAHAARYLPDTPLSRRIIQANLERAQDSNNAQRWDQLWTEVDRMYVPPGRRYAEFQNRKVQVHMLMSRGTDLAEMEQAVGALQQDLTRHLSRMLEPGDSPPTNAPSSAESSLVLRITAASGQVLAIPAELLPPFANRRIPPAALDRIYSGNLDDEASILAELWRHYETLMVARQQALLARNQPLIDIGPTQVRRITFPQESIPAEYFSNGFPPDLVQRLRQLTTEREMVEEMHVYCAEERQLQNLQARESVADRGLEAFLPPGWRPKERLTLADYARQSGLPEHRIPWTYRNRELSPESQKRLAMRLASRPAANPTAVMDELHRFEVDELHHRLALEAIQARRRLLDQMPLPKPPIQIDIIPVVSEETPPPPMSSDALPAANLPLTGTPGNEMLPSRTKK